MKHYKDVTRNPISVAGSGRRWWRVAAFAAFFAVTLAALLVWRHYRQLPRYQGKTIAQWFAEHRAAQSKIFTVNPGGVVFTTAPSGARRVFYVGSVTTVQRVWFTGNPVPDERTIRAMRAMGADGALWLAQEVRQKDSSAAKLYFKILGKLPPAIQKHAPNIEPRDPIRCDAAQVLAAMGANAAPAVPLLLEILSDGSNSRSVRPYVAQVLRSAPFEQELLDPTLRQLQRKDLYGAVELISELSLKTKQAACVLTNAMRATNFMGRPLAVSAFYNFQEHADIVIPVLTPLLASGDLALVESAGAVLQRFGEKAAPALPAALEALKSTDPGIRYEAVRVLEAMGTNALPALAQLQQAGDDSSIMVQRASARTLEQIERQISKEE